MTKCYEFGTILYGTQNGGCELMGHVDGSIDRSSNSRGGGCFLLVVRMFHIFTTNSASIE